MTVKNQNVKTDKLVMNPGRKKDTRGGTLDELIESIRVNGFRKDEPIDAAPDGSGSYLIMDGERRVNAARQCGVEDIPARVHETLNEYTDFVSVHGDERVKTQAKQRFGR